MRRIRPGFTTRARCLIAGGLTAALCGLLFGEVDLIRAGSLVVAVPIVAAIVVNRSQVTIASRRGVSHGRAAAGSEVVIQLTVTNRSLLSTGALMLEDRLPAGLTGRARFVLDGLNGRETRTVAYHVPALPRGSYTAGPLRVRLTDPFGLIDATRSFTARSRFVITPVVDRLPDLHLPNSWDLGENAGSHSIGSRGADDASTREWRHGDDLRKIHWRSTARTGTLMVRHEERPWQGHATLLLDLRAQAHDAPDQTIVVGDDRHRRSIEWAISAVASIGSQLFLTGREVSLIADPKAADRARFASQTSFVDHLAEVVPTRNDSLLPLVPQLRAAMRDSTVVAVLGRVDDATCTRSRTRTRGVRPLRHSRSCSMSTPGAPPQTRPTSRISRTEPSRPRRSGRRRDAGLPRRCALPDGVSFRLDPATPCPRSGPACCVNAADPERRRSSPHG